MKRQIIISNKKYTMEKMSVDTYMDYLELKGQIFENEDMNFTKENIEVMLLFICKAYGNQFTVEELKDKNTGLDIAGVITEFMSIEIGVADELGNRMEKIQKSFSKGK